MKILAIETSSPPGSVALRSSGTTISRAIDSTSRTTEKFAVEIQQLLLDHEISANDVDIVATTIGPGSFTGLRIGATAAKVFAHVTGARLVAVNTLELLAHQVPAEGEIEAVLDAQRGDLFAARFSKTAAGRIETLRETAIISATDWIARYSADAFLVGTGLKRIEDHLQADNQIIEKDLWVPRANTMADCVDRDLERFAAVDPLALTPQYFRRSAAEEKADAKSA